MGISRRLIVRFRPNKAEMKEEISLYSAPCSDRRESAALALGKSFFASLSNCLVTKFLANEIILAKSADQIFRVLVLGNSNSVSRLSQEECPESGLLSQATTLSRDLFRSASLSKTPLSTYHRGLFDWSEKASRK